MGPELLLAFAAMALAYLMLVGLRVSILPYVATFLVWLSIFLLFDNFARGHTRGVLAYNATMIYLLVGGLLFSVILWPSFGSNAVIGLALPPAVAILLFILPGIAAKGWDARERLYLSLAAYLPIAASSLFLGLAPMAFALQLVWPGALAGIAL